MRYTLVTCAIAALTTIASADVISFTADSSTSTENSGAMFSGSLEYIFNGGDTGTLIVSLTNDTSADIGGFLTGFVFNVTNLSDAALISLSFSSNAAFSDTGLETAAPFGLFDAGAALGGNWEGGGTPSLGMGVGVSETFEFMVVANNADSYLASSFIGEGTEFAVRFRGFDDGGSDKFLIPTPGTGVMALFGLAYAGRRRR